jgi:hypothetical protein
MKQIIEKFLFSFLSGETLLRAYTQFKEYLSLSNFRNKEELFTSYYRNNLWKCNETISGAGSTIKYTENIRKEIPKLINPP